MTAGSWIARPGSEVRHLQPLWGCKWATALDDGRVRWHGACSKGDIDCIRPATPHVDEADMHLYRPCAFCVRLLRWRLKFLAGVLADAEAVAA